MYIRPGHAEHDLGVLHDFVRTYPLGQLTTAIPSSHGPTIQTSHMPFVLDAAPSDSDSPGVLRAHMARANPQAKALREAAASSPTGDAVLPDEVLVLFNAPVHAYVTPTFYTETKPETGKVVPTWNYAAVQVYGKVRVFAENDADAGAFLGKQIADLTDMMEGKVGGHWKVEDAPAKYTELLKKAIIGLEITITRIEGRFKLSQESTDGDWKGVVQGFEGLGTPEGKQMAEMVKERGKGRNIKI